MKGTLLSNQDIDLFLKGEEFTFLLMMELKQVRGKPKIVFQPLECRLQRMDGSDSGRKAQL